MCSNILSHIDNTQKVTDIVWLEEELRQIGYDADLDWDYQKSCIVHRLQSEEEYQLLYRWSEHVGASLEVKNDLAEIFY